jgi:hypothetical protein
MKKSELRHIIREEIKTLLTEKKYNKGDVVTIKTDLWYDDAEGGLTTDEPGLLYLDKGTKMKALNSGKFDDVEWSGDGREMSLEKNWVVGAKSKHDEGDVVKIKTDLWYDDREGLGTEQPGHLYLEKGTKMKALNSGNLDDVEWNGDGREMSLDKDWIK